MILANSTKDWANFLFNPDPDMDMPFRTRIQLADAAFGLQPTKEQPIKSWFEVLTDSKLPSLSGVTIFDDSKTYLDDKWEPWFYTNQFSTYIRNSINSVDTPAYGLKITVKDENSKAGIINVDFSKLPLNIISILPATRTVSNDVGEKRTFIINVDQKANITWFINGTKVQSNTSVSTSTYLNESAAQGSWNVTSVASNINGTDVYSWNWTVRKNSE
jgi:hypothetical protein